MSEEDRPYRPGNMNCESMPLGCLLIILGIPLVAVLLFLEMCG